MEVCVVECTNEGEIYKDQEFCRSLEAETASYPRFSHVCRSVTVEKLNLERPPIMDGLIYLRPTRPLVCTK